MGTVFFSLLLALIVGSYARAFFFMRFIFRDMTRPNADDVVRMNHILGRKRLLRLFLSFFTFILFIKVRWYLYRRRRSKRFISEVNLLIDNIHKYSLEREYVDMRLGKILQNYDRILFYNLNSYHSHKPWPIIKLCRNILIINKDNSLDFHLTLSAGKGTLLLALGSPMVDPTLREYIVSNEIISEFGSIFGPQKEFMKNLSLV